VIENLKQSKFSTRMRQLHLFQNKEHGDMLSPKRIAQGAKEAIENEIGIRISKCNFHTNYEINPAEKVQKRGGLKTSFCPERVATIYLCLKVINDITYSALFWQSNGMNHYLRS